MRYSGIIAAAGVVLALSACDQTPTAAEAPKTLTLEEARKIRKDNWQSASEELEKAKAELEATQEKLAQIVEGKAEGDVEALAKKLDELQGKVALLNTRVFDLANPRSTYVPDPVGEHHEKKDATTTPAPAATEGDAAKPAEVPPPPAAE